MPDPVLYLQYREGGKGLRNMFYAAGFDGQNMLDVALVEMESSAQSPQVPPTASRNRGVMSAPKHPNIADLTEIMRPHSIVMASSAQWSEASSHWMFQSGCVYELAARGADQSVALRALTPFDTLAVSSVGRIPLDLATRSKAEFDSLTLQEAGVAVALAIMFAYYAASVAGSVLGQLGAVSPAIAAWLPNGCGCMVLLFLLRR
eukprot:jgi/Chlat1/4650/Chrsp3S09026